MNKIGLLLLLVIYFFGNIYGQSYYGYFTLDMGKPVVTFDLTFRNNLIFWPENISSINMRYFSDNEPTTFGVYDGERAVTNAITKWNNISDCITLTYNNQSSTYVSVRFLNLSDRFGPDGTKSAYTGLCVVQNNGVNPPRRDFSISNNASLTSDQTTFVILNNTASYNKPWIASEPTSGIDGKKTYLPYVILHELGHVKGLGHLYGYDSGNPQVMASGADSSKPPFKFTEDDISFAEHAKSYFRPSSVGPITFTPMSGVYPIPSGGFLVNMSAQELKGGEIYYNVGIEPSSTPNVTLANAQYYYGPSSWRTFINEGKHCIKACIIYPDKTLSIQSVASYNLYKGTTGVYDYINLSPSNPIEISQNSSYLFSWNLVDVDNSGTTFTGSAKIYLQHSDGEIPLAIQEISSTNNNHQILIGEIPKNYCWIRDINNYILGRLVVSGLDSDLEYHTASSNVRLIDVPQNTVSGTLIKDETWCGLTTITGDVIVPEGKALFINPGARLYFNNGSSLIVKGNLNIRGTSDMKVNIDFDTQNSTMQNGIKLNSGSNSSISSAVIKNAYRGIDINQAYANISGCEISGCSSHGINMYGALSNTTISNCNIHNNTGTGIVMYYSSPLLTNNVISNNLYGIAIADQSSPLLGKMGTYGNNHIFSNRAHGITVTRGCSPFMGENICIENGGHNNISDNGTSSNGKYNISVFSNSVVVAENNWWNFIINSEYDRIADPQYLYCDGSSILDCYPPADPADLGNLNFSANIKTKTPEESLFDNAFSNTTVNYSTQNNLISNIAPAFNAQWSILKKLEYARYMLFLNKDKDAEQICKDVIKNNADSSLCSFALNILWQSGQKNNLDDFKSYLTQVSTSNDEKLVTSMSKILSTRFDKENKIKILDEVISCRKNDKAKTFNKNENNYIIESALFCKLLYYCNDNKDMGKARDIVTEIDNIFQKGSPSSIEAHGLIGEDISGNIILIKNENSSENSDSIQKITEYSLQGNYPNPFNPSTRISYALPMQSKVELKVYDGLGREIKTLVNTVQEAGRYDVMFNASGMPSGLYIYTIKAQSLENNKTFEKTAKMMFLK